MKWGGWCSCSCWLESEEMRRTRKKWSWQWRWLWNIAETCEHTHKDQFRLELNIHQISEHNHSDGRHSLTKRLWTIVNYRKLSWTIVKICEVLLSGWWLDSPRLRSPCSTWIRSAAGRLARIGRSAAALRGSAGTRRRAQFWSTSGPVPGTLRWYGPWVRQPLASEKRRILTYFNSEENRGNTLSQYMLINIILYWYTIGDPWRT